ncbi:hypothetical protein V8E51_011642 [Hyaloscypha variabilis]
MAPLRGTKRRRATHLTTPKKKRKIELVDRMQEEVIAPQEGIHSLAWAQAIVPQPQGLLKLPIEVRNLIYGYLDQWTIISPRKSKKGKFVNRLQYYKAIDTCVTLSQVCKQLFVDITGSGLLYYTNHFLFYTPFTMTQYLASIQPYHNFRAISLRVPICRHTSITGSLATLASFPSLTRLIIVFDVPTYLCTVMVPSPRPGVRMYKANTKVLQQLGREKWDMLRNRLLDFDLDFTVSPKMVVLDSRWGFHRSLGICLDTCLGTWDPKIKELEKKIKDVVLKK